MVKLFHQIWDFISDTKHWSLTIPSFVALLLSILNLLKNKFDMDTKKLDRIEPIYDELLKICTDLTKSLYDQMNLLKKFCVGGPDIYDNIHEISQLSIGKSSYSFEVNPEVPRRISKKIKEVFNDFSSFIDEINTYIASIDDGRTQISNYSSTTAANWNKCFEKCEKTVKEVEALIQRDKSGLAKSSKKRTLWWWH